MRQPFEPLTKQYVSRLIELKKNYLVTQSYPNGAKGDEPGIPLLVSAYDDPGLAKTHWNAVKEDPYAAIVHLTRPVHLQKLTDMLDAGSEYLVYWAVVRSSLQVEKTINRLYKDRMRRYIEKNTNWRIDRNASIRPVVQLVFGHLYLILKNGTQQIRVKFEEIESA